MVFNLYLLTTWQYLLFIIGFSSIVLIFIGQEYLTSSLLAKSLPISSGFWVLPLIFFIKNSFSSFFSTSIGLSPVQLYYDYSPGRTDTRYMTVSLLKDYGILDTVGQTLSTYQVTTNGPAKISWQLAIIMSITKYTHILRGVLWSW